MLPEGGVLTMPQSAQRAWELLLRRAPPEALAEAAPADVAAGWFALASTPTGARVPADLLLAVPLPDRHAGASGNASGVRIGTL